MDFGKFLNQKRAAAKITVRGFAQKVGISPSFLCDLESGNRAFPAKSKKNPNLMDKMIEALGLNEEDTKRFKEYAEESMLMGNRLPDEISEYLRKVPEAQGPWVDFRENIPVSGNKGIQRRWKIA
ncbi:MAG: helix-turn-helix domain-containing protein [Candidatus Enteromonas sp.]